MDAEEENGGIAANASEGGLLVYLPEVIKKRTLLKIVKGLEVRRLRRVMSFLGERGVTSIEYAIIAAAIAMGIILAVTAIGNQVGSVYTDMGSSFPK